MKTFKSKKDRFDHSVSVLVKAFFEGTLAKGSCAACAVGNLVADVCGYKITENLLDYDQTSPMWHFVFVTDMITGIQELSPECYSGEIARQIDSTGYTWQELAKVEKMFELNTLINFQYYNKYTKQEIMQDQYNGLMAVVDVLAEINEIDLTTTNQAKELFDYEKSSL